VFAAMCALVPAGVWFTATFLNYTYTGQGTGPAIDAAPGPLLGAGIIPAIVALGAAYYAARKFRARPSGN